MIRATGQQSILRLGAGLLFRALAVAVATAVLSLLAAGTVFAQARYTAVGPGTYIQVGGTVSAFDSDYGKRILGGGTLFADAHLYRRIGLEAEARRLFLRSDDGMRQTTYMVGPKISFKPRSVRPYLKLLAGRGEFRFPYGYADGSYFALAPGGGLDWRLGHNSRWTWRVLDAEYQIWPGFSYGPLHPIGASTGLALRVW